MVENQSEFDAQQPKTSGSELQYMLRTLFYHSQAEEDTYDEYPNSIAFRI